MVSSETSTLTKGDLSGIQKARGHGGGAFSMRVKAAAATPPPHHDRMERTAEPHGRYDVSLAVNIPVNI